MTLFWESGTICSSFSWVICIFSEIIIIIIFYGSSQTLCLAGYCFKGIFPGADGHWVWPLRARGLPGSLRSPLSCLRPPGAEWMRARSQAQPVSLALSEVPGSVLGEHRSGPTRASCKEEGIPLSKSAHLEQRHSGSFQPTCWVGRSCSHSQGGRACRMAHRPARSPACVSLPGTGRAPRGPLVPPRYGWGN